MDVPQMMYADPALVDKIVGELKSQGTFDQFRKECIADVDTKPAYQNLHQRVETMVSNFLDGRTWRPDLNKNQLRDSLRKHIHEMGFLETGVERIVDQVVNPKVHSIFMPQVEDVVYRVQGIPKPDKKSAVNSSSAVGSTSKNAGVINSSLFSNPPPFLPGLSFLPPALQSHMQKAPTLADLLPTDLDPVSPESNKESDGSVVKEESENSNMAEQSGIIQHHDGSEESQLSGISDLTSHGSEPGPHAKCGGEKPSDFDESNEDSHLSKISSTSKLSCNSTNNKVQRTESLVGIGSETFEESHEKSSYPNSSIVQYGDQFTMEEEVATTVTNPQEEIALENFSKEEPEDDVKKSPNVDNNLSEDDKLEKKTEYINPVSLKYKHNEERTVTVDENSLVRSEDSQCSESSDIKLHIDEMKDSQSENSHQHEDERSCMKTSSEELASEENHRGKTVVEASEEARHGFDDSQDALETQHLSHTPTNEATNFSVKETPDDINLKIEEGSSHPLITQQGVLETSSSSSDKLNDDAEKPFPPSAPLLAERLSPMVEPPPHVVETTDVDASPLPPTTPKTLEQPPLPPLTPPLPQRSMNQERPPLPPTPPIADRLSFVERPPLPSMPPEAEKQDGPPLPPTPPIAERLSLVERPPLPSMPPEAEKQYNPPLPSTPPLPPLLPIPQCAAVMTPPRAGEEFSLDSNVSPSYDEGAIPRTPRWEPRSPSTETDSHKFPPLEFLGISDLSQIPQSFIPSSRTSAKEQDDVSQSGSEEMQLAWSPLSTHGGDANEDSREKHSAEGPNVDNSSEKVKPSLPEDSTSFDKDNHARLQTDDKNRDSKKDDRHKTGDKDKSRERGRERDQMKEEKSKERRKDDDRTHKESASSSRKHDERTSKHRANHDRKDSTSRSRHDDKNRSEKDRERRSSSSHHKSDDKRRDDKDRGSSKHRSSHSDDRYKHRDRERRNSSTRHDDKNRDKSSKSEDRSKSTSKTHSSDRRDQDKKERDSKDKEKRCEKDKEHSRKDHSRHDDKRKEKDRDKTRKDKSSNMCRPNNERRTPDPDSTNGSMFGGNNQSLPSVTDKVSQHQDSNNQDTSKNSGSGDSNNKNSDSCQHNNLSMDLQSLSSTSANQSCPSSLPFKKRPLLAENDNELVSGLLILKIRKLNSNVDKPRSKTSQKMKALRRLERKTIRNLNNDPKFSPQQTDEDLPPSGNASPTKYFDGDWPTKTDDNAFIAYVHALDQSKSLSGMSDLSESDSEEEEVLSISDLKNPYGLEDKSAVLSLTVMTEEQARELSIFKDNLLKGKESKLKLQGQKPAYSSLKGKSSLKRRKSDEESSEVKRRKVSSKEIAAPPPAEQKSRRTRKPNKRYSNDEFTSHFDYEEEFDSLEEENMMVKANISHQEEPNEKVARESEVSQVSQLSNYCHEEKELLSSPITTTVDQQEKESKLYVPDGQTVSIVSHSPKEAVVQSKLSTCSWDRDSYHSNSEDETNNASSETDLIGTALKNLMMESGFGGPDEASRTEKLPSAPCSNNLNPSSVVNHKSTTIPLSGVKRVGLSKNYKGRRRRSLTKSASSEIYLPSSPTGDLAASTSDKGSVSKPNHGSQLSTFNFDVSTDLSERKNDGGRVNQHYSSDDLYKPRLPIRCTSKRRQAISQQSGRC